MRVPFLQPVLYVLLGALAACGGGGGGGGSAPLVIDGLSGRVLMPDFDLGRIAEQEPNDSTARPARLPPVFPRSILEVTGELGRTAAQFGRIDPVDVFLFTSVRTQMIELELDFPSIDPALGGPNNFTAEVFRRATGASVSVTGPGFPRTLGFEAVAEEAYDIVLTAIGGHGWYTLRLVGSDPLPGPQLNKPALGQTVLSAVSPAAQPSEPPPVACAGTHVLVRFDADCDPEAFCAREGLELGRRTGTGSYRVRLPAHDVGEAAAVALCERLTGLAGVRWVEPDYVVRSLGIPTDPEFNRQWNMRAIGAPSAWDVETGDADVVVAVVDAGIVPHPDIADRIVPGYDFVSDPVIAADGDGRDGDPTDPGDRARSSGLSLWHGTHVSTIIAGRANDGFGVTGVAPDCRVMMLRALGVGGGFVSDAADAILFAAGLYTTPDGRVLPAPIRIVNLSIGLDQDSEELRDACERAANRGCLLVAAVGNGGGAVQYPARYDSTFAVAAVDGKLQTTSYSSFGASVDIAAPGGGTSFDQWNDGWHDGILSATRDQTVDPARYGSGYIVGTSQAAPHVAGAAALMLSMDPTLTSTELTTILRATALDLGLKGDDLAYGSGLVQVHEALKVVMERQGNPRNDAPYLMLPTNSVQFEGLRTSIDVPLMNGGGGTANVFFAFGETDDGALWLGAQLTAADGPGVPVNNTKVTITVDRSQLPLASDSYSGTVHLADSQGTLQTIRVTTYVRARQRAGQILPLAAIDAFAGIARRRAFAYPEFGYRYWLRGMPAASYRLQAGEDLDRDGFFCEVADACGWHGGPTEADAIPVEFVPNEPVVSGLSIDLSLTPP